VGLLSEKGEERFEFQEPLLSELIDLWLETGKDWLRFSKDYPNLADAMGSVHLR
jgi:hypothetical protein